MIRSRRHKNKRPFGSRRGDRSSQPSTSQRGSGRSRSGTSAAAPLKLDQSIVLIGLMGAGKTTIGRRLARALGVGFVDSDHEIEKAAQMSVSDIFDRYGEAEFRAVERRVINRLIKGRAKVIATGGGAFMNAETRALIKASATSIWLNADIGVLVERTSRRDTRPLLKQGDPAEILTKLAAERNPIYAEATLMVRSSDGPHENVVSGMVSQLRDHFKKLKVKNQKKERRAASGKRAAVQKKGQRGSDQPADQAPSKPEDKGDSHA